MSLLSVTVKKARYVGIQATQYNTYVTLKLQNVKSTTVTVKGPTPSWEQDFLFEINDINLGLLVEVWNKGVIWDRALGYHYLPLTTVAYEEQEVGGRWIELETQLIMRGGAVVGTAGPTTGHGLLLDCRFELPFDAEGTAGADLQRKLDMLNGTLDAERAEQARRQMQYMAHSGYSEDSDYTSDLNYPVGQHPNCSASQFRTAAHQMRTPQRSLEASRENSYEREEYHLHGDADPLYYNSQPRTRIESWAQYQPELHAQASIESAISWRTAAEWQSGEEQRRPSLERQRSLYDDIGYAFDSYTNATHIRDHSHISHQPSYEEYYDTSSYPYQATYVGEDTRPWDRDRYNPYDESFGLTPTEYENLVNKRRSSVVQLPQLPNKQATSTRYSELNGMAPYRPRQPRIAASLPATPSSTPKRSRVLPSVPGSECGSIRSGRGRKLPRPPYPAPVQSSQTLYKETDNAVPDVNFSFASFVYSQPYEDTPMDQYQDQNYNTYDDDGMQPFFDETPHATPPAAVHKQTWNESETISQFTYPLTKDDDYYKTQKTVPSTISSYLPQVPVRSKNNQYQDHTYQDYDLQFDMTQQYDKYSLQDQEYNQYLQENQCLDQKPLNNQQNYVPEKVTLDQKTLQQHNQNLQYQDDKFFNQQYQQQQKLTQQYQNQQHQQQPQQQQKLPAQQLQNTVLTGAATLGSLMAGGAKKLGSLFGAAAAAVAPPTMTQASLPPANTTSVPFTSAMPTLTSFTTSSSITVPVVSVPEVLPPVPVTSTTPAITLPRTPSLRRQESILRPPVHRTRTLPEAPDDVSLPFEESISEDEYHKTDYEQSFDHDLDKTSLDRYPEDEPDRLIKETEGVDEYPKEIISVLPKIVSPPKTTGSVRVSSSSSNQSSASTVMERKTSQTSFHQDDKISLTAAQEETAIDKTKVTFKEDRTTYHEVPETSDTYREESFDEHQDDFQSTDERYPESDDNYTREQEKYDDQEQLDESEEQYHDENEFEKEQKRKLERKQEFKEEQPKLTPKQRWHRAYNKIVMQLNVLTVEALKTAEGK